jgi:hypothetical protein
VSSYTALQIDGQNQPISFHSVTIVKDLTSTGLAPSLTDESMFWSPRRTTAGRESRAPGSRMQWPAVSTKRELMRLPPQLNVYPPSKFAQPIAACANFLCVITWHIMASKVGIVQSKSSLNNFKFYIQSRVVSGTK